MKKEQVLGIVRPLLTALLSAFAAKYFGEETIAAIVASVGAAIVAFWGIADKTTHGLPAWASAFRHVLAAFSGVAFVFWGDNKVVVEVITAVGAILAALSGGVANSEANRAK
jgi:hypothetical protein